METKRAISTVGSYTLIVVVLLTVLFPITGKAMGLIDRINLNDDGQGCYLLLGVIKYDRGDWIDHKCTTSYQEIPGEAYASTQDQLMHMFAKKIQRAWFVTHEGTIDRMWSDGWGNLFNGEEQCITLFVETYTGARSQEEFSIGRMEFLTYLLTKKAKDDDGVSYTYVDYVQNYRGKGILFLLPSSIDVDDISEAVREENYYDTLPEDNYLEYGKTYAIAVASRQSPFFRSSRGNQDNAETANIVIFGERDKVRAIGCQELTQTT